MHTIFIKNGYNIVLRLDIRIGLYIVSITLHSGGATCSVSNIIYRKYMAYGNREVMTILPLKSFFLIGGIVFDCVRQCVMCMCGYMFMFMSVCSGGSRGAESAAAPPPLFSADFCFFGRFFFIFGRGIEEFGFPAPPFHRSWIRLWYVYAFYVSCGGVLYTIYFTNFLAPPVYTLTPSYLSLQ